MADAAASCTLPPAPPLVSLLILTCNRPGFLRLALKAAAQQTYRPLEAVVVDDGERGASSSVEELRSLVKIPIRMVRLGTRRSIGSKRNAGVSAARGAIVMHWDDDDMHAPTQVEALACPILRNMSDFTCLTFSYLARLSSDGIEFYDYRRGRQGRAATGPFLGSLAYSRSLAVALSQASGSSSAEPTHTSQRVARMAHGKTASPRLAPFPPFSLSEDLHFVERALLSCYRMLPISNTPIVYTRHAAASLTNTWQPADFSQRLTGLTTAAPLFITPEMRAEYIRAEDDAARHGACSVLARKEPADIARPLHFPYNPSACCHGRRPEAVRRPCTDAAPGAPCSPDETFCGASKGVCTASCTCAGERTHGAPGKTACGLNCCLYWKRFWKLHPENCSTTRSNRPLKRVYCGESGGGAPEAGGPTEGLPTNEPKRSPSSRAGASKRTGGSKRAVTKRKARVAAAADHPIVF